MESIEISVQAMPEQPCRQAQGTGGNQGHRPDLIDEQGQAGSFEKNPPYHNEKIPHWVDDRDILHPLRHIGNGRGEAG